MRLAIGLLSVVACCAQMDTYWMWKDVSRYMVFSTWSPPTVDASGEYCGLVFRVPRSGTITGVGIDLWSVTSGTQLTVGLETLLNGNPSGSAYGGSSPGTLSVSSNGAYVVDLQSAATANAGDFVAVVARWVSGTFACYGPGSVRTLPYNVGNPLSSSGTYSFAIRYSDGWELIGSALIVTKNLLSYSSSSAQYEHGTRFVSPVTGKMCGVWAYFAMSAGATAAVNVYDHGYNTIATVNIGTTLNGYHSSTTPGIILFDSPVYVTAGAVYTVSLQATSTVSVTVPYWADKSSSIPQISVFSRGQLYRVSRGSSGWTEYQDHVLGVGPLFCGAESSAPPPSVAW